jgi:hypothetical protein
MRHSCNLDRYCTYDQGEEIFIYLYFTTLNYTLGCRYVVASTVLARRKIYVRVRIRITDTVSSEVRSYKQFLI